MTEYAPDPPQRERRVEATSPPPRSRHAGQAGASPPRDSDRSALLDRVVDQLATVQASPGRLGRAVPTRIRPAAAPVIQRSLADVDPEDLAKLEKAFRIRVEAALDKASNAKALIALATTTWFAMAKKVIDLAGDDSRMLTTMLEGLDPGSLTRMADMTAKLDCASVASFANGLGSEQLLASWHKGIIGIASQCCGVTVPGTSDAIRDAKDIIRLSAGPTIDIGVIASKIEGMLGGAAKELPGLTDALSLYVAGATKIGLDQFFLAGISQAAKVGGKDIVDWKRAVEASVLDGLKGVDLRGQREAGLQLLGALFTVHSPKQFAVAVLSGPAPDKRLTAGQLALLLHRRYGFAFVVDDAESDMGVILGALNRLPEADVTQEGSATKWITSFTVVVKGAQVDAVGGTYDTSTQAIRVRGSGSDAKAIEGAVRHEVGHAVDERIGWSKSKRFEAPECGAWREYSPSKDNELGELVQELITATGSKIASWTGPTKAWAIETLLREAKERSSGYTQEDKDRRALASGRLASGELEQRTELYRVGLQKSPAYKLLAEAHGRRPSIKEPEILPFGSCKYRLSKYSWDLDDGSGQFDFLMNGPARSLVDNPESGMAQWPEPAQEWAAEGLALLEKGGPSVDIVTEKRLRDLAARLFRPQEVNERAEPDASTLFADPVYDLLHASPDGWNNDDGGGRQIGTRIYKKNAYYNRWYSYEKSARSTKVSNYQFYAPAEWFAELYSEYYGTPTPGDGIPATAGSTIEKLLGRVKQ